MKLQLMVTRALAKILILGEKLNKNGRSSPFLRPVVYLIPLCVGWTFPPAQIHAKSGFLVPQSPSCTELYYHSNLMLQRHIRAQDPATFERELKSKAYGQRVIRSLMNSIDPLQVFFLKSDVEKWEKESQAISDFFLYQGSCEIFQKIIDDGYMGAQRFAESLAKTPISSPELERSYIASQALPPVIAKEFNEYPENGTERSEEIGAMILARYSKLRQKALSPQVAANSSLLQIKKQTAPDLILSTRWAELTANAFLQALDTHSKYLTGKQYRAFLDSLSASDVSLGLQLEPSDMGLTILGLKKGGSAEQSGKLNVGDVILAIDGDSEVIWGRPEDYSERLSGKPDSWVQLTVLRHESKGAHPFLLRLQRRPFNNQAKKISVEITTRMGQTLAYIKVPEFYQGNKKSPGLAASLNQLYRNFQRSHSQAPIDGILLDLSDNDGGVLNEALDMVRSLIPKGHLLNIYSGPDRLEHEIDDDNQLQWSKPVAILVGPDTASASEITSGILQDYHRALIIGPGATFGKGCIQDVYDWQNEGSDHFDGGLIVTSSFYYLPSGRPVQFAGITPDILLPRITKGSVKSERELNPQLKPPAAGPSAFSSWQRPQMKKWESDQNFKATLEELKSNYLPGLDANASNKDQAIELLAGWVELHRPNNMRKKK